MALRALKIVKETLDCEIERVVSKMDAMVGNHRRKVEYARVVMGGGYDSVRAGATGLSDPLAARRYLDSCGPSSDWRTTPDWITLPEKDLQRHGELARQAGRLAGLRGKLVARIERECIEQPEPVLE